MLASRGSAVLWSLALLCCGTDTPPNDSDAATAADAGAEMSGAGGTAGTGGGSGGMGGAGAASGSAGSAGATAGSAGSGGGTGGRGGSEDAGGAAGSARGGQAGTSIGDPDASRDAADGSIEAGRGDGPDADASAEGAADGTDARADAGAPPSDAADCTPLPSAGVYATFRVVADVFYVSITNPPGIDQALALWRGQSQAKIPVGQLECGNGTYNCGWTWRMNPAAIAFAEVTIEVCDATPTYVQNNCASFPNGQYCPWSAQLITLRDCRTDPSCPAVPR